ncbi:MAG: DUF805 domain-containing protein [Novosphingobium sp.]
MSFSVVDKSRIGRSGYWTAFVINIVAIVALIGACVAAAMSGHFAAAILLFLLVAPVGIYFRVVMMRRCRDIDWPAFLPWALFAAGILANLARASQGLEGLRNPNAGIPALLIGLIDFGFMIAIGCIDSKDRAGDYVRQFYDEDDQPLARSAAAQPAARMPSGYDADAASAQRALLSGREQEEAGWDAAIARALEARQQDGGADSHRPVAPAVQRPAPALQRPAGGFGRRVV